MADEKVKKNSVSVNDLRHAEYYGMQSVFDELYARSCRGDIFNDLIKIITSRENVLLAYRNLKTNIGSKTEGVDGITINELGKMSPENLVENVVKILCGKRGYNPKPVKRVEIPKSNGSTRPLGIPCIWDRLIQQCIKQVLEPICEAKFSDSSYGFRPQRNMEQAIAETYRLLQKCNNNFVVEIDIKGFFDNVNHQKLIRQIWAMGIHDKQLIYIIKQILRTPILLPHGEILKCYQGTPQGGIISPLFANIYLNEFDKWINSQWKDFPIKTTKYSWNKNGSPIKSNEYKSLRKTNLKEIYLVRYADDIRIFCKSYQVAMKIKIATEQWLKERLKLELSEDKTKIVNTKEKYTEFLGFKIKLIQKGNTFVVSSRMSDKSLKKVNSQLIEQAKRIAKPTIGKSEYDEIKTYNSMVLGIQNYYKIATNISLDLAYTQRAVMTVFTARLQKGNRMKKVGPPLSSMEQRLYGKSKMLRYVAKHPIYPIGCVQTKPPMCRKLNVCCYTESGRKGLHDNLNCNIQLMLRMMKQPVFDKSIEYTDNRISLFSEQKGKCIITGKLFSSLEEIHCHHIIPKAQGGSDKYENLVLMLEPIHRLIHATNNNTIEKYLNTLELTKEQIEKINKYRATIGIFSIEH